MAILALHSASTGLSALSTELDVISNNIANINTQGFKRSRVNFQDLMYLEKKQAGVENANGDVRPIGLNVGLGVQVSGTHKSFEAGPAQPTGRELDIMINGIGFLQVSIESDRGPDGIGYSRAGALTKNSDGQLVLASDQGRILQPEITISEDAIRIDITPDGRVLEFLPGEPDASQAGQLELAAFINPAGLKEIGENLFVKTAASGEPVVDVPTAGSFGELMQGFLEGSNVEPVEELVNLIKTQRAFELNSQSIKAADEALQQINQLRRR